MNRDTDLIRMANQIAQAFAVYPEAEATAGIAKHIKDFWDPQMRERIAVLATDGDNVGPAVRQALAKLAAV
jgi:formate dehydrogenase subunit delta